MKKLFRNFITSIFSIFAFLLLFIGITFLFNLFPMNNYLSYLIAIAFFVAGGMIVFKLLEE